MTQGRQEEVKFSFNTSSPTIIEEHLEVFEKQLIALLNRPLYQELLEFYPLAISNIPIPELIQNLKKRKTKNSSDHQFLLEVLQLRLYVNQFLQAKEQSGVTWEKLLKFQSGLDFLKFKIKELHTTQSSAEEKLDIFAGCVEQQMQIKEHDENNLILKIYESEVTENLKSEELYFENNLKQIQNDLEKTNLTEKFQEIAVNLEKLNKEIKNLDRKNHKETTINFQATRKLLQNDFEQAEEIIKQSSEKIRNVISKASAKELDDRNAFHLAFTKLETKWKEEYKKVNAELIPMTDLLEDIQQQQSAMTELKINKDSFDIDSLKSEETFANCIKQSLDNLQQLFVHYIKNKIEDCKKEPAALELTIQWNKLNDDLEEFKEIFLASENVRSLQRKTFKSIPKNQSRSWLAEKNEELQITSEQLASLPLKVKQEKIHKLLANLAAYKEDLYQECKRVFEHKNPTENNNPFLKYALLKSQYLIKLQYINQMDLQFLKAQREKLNATELKFNELNNQYNKYNFSKRAATQPEPKKTSWKRSIIKVSIFLGIGCAIAFGLVACIEWAALSFPTILVVPACGVLLGVIGLGISNLISKCLCRTKTANNVPVDRSENHLQNSVHSKPKSQSTLMILNVAGKKKNLEEKEDKQPLPIKYPLRNKVIQFTPAEENNFKKLTLP